MNGNAKRNVGSNAGTIKWRFASLAALTFGAASSCSGPVDKNAPSALNPLHTMHRDAHSGDEHEVDPVPVIARTPQRKNISLVSSLDFGSAADFVFGDVWVHRNRAYLGGADCGRGVSVADVSNPAHPVSLGTFANHPQTSAEDVEVLRVQTPYFTGDLLATGLQRKCGDGSGLRGLELWNVTNASAPVRLGFLDTRAGTGVHELKMFERNGRVYVIFAAPGSESDTIFDNQPRLGDVRIADITNPRNPVELSNWAANRDAGLQVGDDLEIYGHPCIPTGTPTCRMTTTGGFAATFGHSVGLNRDATRAYVAFWDAGMVILDIRNLARPKMLGRGAVPANEEGDIHSAIDMPFFNGLIAVTTDEDFSPPFNENGETNDIWGRVHVWSVANPARPIEIGKFQTANSRSAKSDGSYSVHNPVAIGPLLFTSWYTDGIRVLDMRVPTNPSEIAFHEGPYKQAGPTTAHTFVPTGYWGISVKLPYIYASDMKGGLYVHRIGLPLDVAALIPPTE